MQLKTHIRQAVRRLSGVKKGGLHLLLLSSLFLPFFLILFLDFFDIEAFGSFNSKFMFDLTWKGRMFYLFFMWLILLESVLNWETIIERQQRRRNRFRLLLACVLVAVPLIYVLGVNFLGWDQAILDLGKTLSIKDISEPWPLSVEYLVLVSFFVFATWLAYGLVGLKSFSISLSLLAGIGCVYLVDTVWPYGTLEPMELVAVPTAAFATTLLSLLGYEATLMFPSPYIEPFPALRAEYGSMPYMLVERGVKSADAHVAWACAGVHSLLLFTLIALVFFKKSTMHRERKIVYFLVGAAGTYFTNILRITSYFVISVHHGKDAGWVFHNSYGELYFVAWMFAYVIIIVAIQSGKINRFTQPLRKRLKVLRFYTR